jgi:hypothetical protein
MQYEEGDDEEGHDGGHEDDIGHDGSWALTIRT